MIITQKKKVFIILVFALFYNLSVTAEPNSIVNRLTALEVAQCRTPAAVAYNFIIAALVKDFDRMYAYMTKDGRQYMQYEMDNHEVKSLNALFSLEGKLHIYSWLPALYQGYEVAVLYVQDESTYNGVEYKKVYVGCVSSSQMTKDISMTILQASAMQQIVAELKFQRRPSRQ